MTPTNNYGCVSYPTAKALMLAGLEFETNICYNEEGGIFEAKGSGEILYLKTGKFSHIGTVDFVASPTFEDIWNALPKDITIDSDIYYLYINKEDDYIGYYNSILRKDYIAIKIKDGLTEATAEMLLLLKKHNLI